MEFESPTKCSKLAFAKGTIYETISIYIEILLQEILICYVDQHFTQHFV
jgi:hypothetical protein